METWRQAAIEHFPAYRLRIEEAEELSDLWISLWGNFLGATYGTRDDSLIHSIYRFAFWCLQDSDEAVDEAIGWFFAHLPDCERARKEMPRWMTDEEFASLQGLFQYERSEEDFHVLVEEFRAGRKKLLRNEPDKPIKPLPKAAFRGIGSQDERWKKRWGSKESE